MKALLAVALAVALAGFAPKPVKMNLADGSEAIYIECGRGGMTGCYQAANEACPDGYYTVSARTRTVGDALIVGNTGSVAGGVAAGLAMSNAAHSSSLTVKCK